MMAATAIGFGSVESSLCSPVKERGSGTRVVASGDGEDAAEARRGEV